MLAQRIDPTIDCYSLNRRRCIRYRTTCKWNRRKQTCSQRFAVGQPYDDGKADGKKKAENEWSGDCADIWTFDDDCEELIKNEFTVFPGDNWKEKEYKAGGEAGVNEVLQKYQQKCTGQCFELGSAAAYKIAREYCGINTSGYRPPDFEIVCRAFAIFGCKWLVGPEISDLINEGGCGDEDEPNIFELFYLQKQCRDTIDDLLS